MNKLLQNILFQKPTDIDMHIDKLQTKLEVDQVTKTGKVTHFVLMDGEKNE